MQSPEPRAGEIAILVAEDDPTARGVLNLTLSKRFPQLQPLLAANGQEGLELFLRHRPRIVLTDIAMPVMDGFAMASAIMADSPGTIIVSISAHSEQEYLRRAAEAGIRLHLEKPVDLMRLFATLEQYLDAAG